MLKCIVLLFALVSITLAAIALEPLEPKPEKFRDNEGCYIRELDTVLPYNETLPSKMNCMEYLCDENYVIQHTCGVAVILPPYKKVEDKKKPYPECCPKISYPSES